MVLEFSVCFVEGDRKTEQGKKRERGNGKFSSRLDSPESERGRKKAEKRERVTCRFA